MLISNQVETVFVQRERERERKRGFWVGLGRVGLSWVGDVGGDGDVATPVIKEAVRMTCPNTRRPITDHPRLAL